MSLEGPVIIDALAARYGGTATATVELANQLAEDPAGVIVVTRTGSLVADATRPNSGLRVLTLARPSAGELARRLLWEAVVLPRIVQRQRASSVLTVSGMLPRPLSVPVVAYLQNAVVFERHDFPNRLRRWALGRTARSAAHVVVPSAAMAARVTEVIGIQADVVPLGVDPARFTPANAPGTEVLCVADFYPHKRHDLILDAWAKLPSPRPTLQLVGDERVDPSWHRRIADQTVSYRRFGEIIISPRMAAHELVDAYHRARVLALATEHESFCLPVLEAQACGVPAVVRDLPALRETGGDATTYVVGADPATWATELGRLLLDDDAHAAARAKGLEHARRFSWERTAAALRARLREPEVADD